MHTANVVTMAQRRKYKDPYALAQAKQRKDANLSRRAELQEQRKVALGDPVRGISTPFLESFDDVGGSTALVEAVPNSQSEIGVDLNVPDDTLLNHFLTAAELKDSIQHSIALTEPVPSKVRDNADPHGEAQEMNRFIEGHKRATVAMTRIVSLANASQKDKTRANTVRCIETFGRHKTDETLRPRPAVNPSILGDHPLPEKTPRAGPDTGSSEVQIAILTAKIRVLANELETKGGKKDKVNKRNLRVMVHKRQKLLKYLQKKERGGDRWQHLISTLGLTEGTWKGEISL
jgi:ribosomal protein S15